MSADKVQHRLPALIAGFLLCAAASCTFYPWWERMLDEQERQESESPGGAVADPVISPTGGNFDAAETITLACATTGATVYYTLDGSDPTPGASGTFTYRDTTLLSLDALHPSLSVKAIALRTGMTPSAIAQAEFRLAYDRSTGNGTLPEPEIGLDGGIFPLDEIRAARTITITCDDPLADIYYNFNGFDGLLPTIFDDPTIPPDSDHTDTSGPPPLHRFNAYYAGYRTTMRYTGPIQVPASENRPHAYLKAFAVRGGYADSPIAMEHYRQPGFPTVLSCTLSENRRAVGQPLTLEIVYQDDTTTLDGGLSRVRISCRAQGHGTTNEDVDPTLCYFEYARPNALQEEEDENAFYFYDAGNTAQDIAFGSSDPVIMNHYSVDPSQCSVVIDNPNKTITLRFVFTPLEAAYDSAEGWKNRKSFWTWMMDDQTGANAWAHNPVTELVRWELTGS